MVKKQNALLNFPVAFQTSFQNSFFDVSQVSFNCYCFSFWHRASYSWSDIIVQIFTLCNILALFHYVVCIIQINFLWKLERRRLWIRNNVEPFWRYVNFSEYNSHGINIGILVGEGAWNLYREEFYINNTCWHVKRLWLLVTVRRLIKVLWKI